MFLVLIHMSLKYYVSRSNARALNYTIEKSDFITVILSLQVEMDLGRERSVATCSAG
jgi:uncharacterized membrane protein